MNRINLGAIAAAFAIVFGANAVAATEAPKDTSKAAESKPAKEKAASKSETAGEYVDDAVITTKVKAAIFEDAALKSTEINVATWKGIVQLSGFVKSAADIKKAAELARTVKGVVSVKNDMIVKGKQ